MEKQVLMRELEEIGFILSKRKIACGRAGASYGKLFSHARGDTNLNCYLSWPNLLIPKGSF